MGETSSPRPRFVWPRLQKQRRDPVDQSRPRTGQGSAGREHLPPIPQLSRDREEARDAIKALIDGLKCTPPQKTTEILIAGDWNADPFLWKGANKNLLRSLTTTCGDLHVVPRANAHCHSRPRAGSHVDNFVGAKWITQACRPLEYCENETFGSTRPISDHSMLILTLSHRIYAEHDTRPRFRVLDTKPLRQGDTAEYQRSLTNLAKIYLAWARRARDAYLCTGATFDETLTTSLYEGLVLIIRSAAHQTLGTRLTRGGEASRKIFYETNSLPHYAKETLWEIVRNRCNTAAEPSNSTPPPLRHLREKPGYNLAAPPAPRTGE